MGGSGAEVGPSYRSEKLSKLPSVSKTEASKPRPRHGSRVPLIFTKSLVEASNPGPSFAFPLTCCRTKGSCRANALACKESQGKRIPVDAVAANGLSMVGDGIEILVGSPGARQERVRRARGSSLAR